LLVTPLSGGNASDDLDGGPGRDTLLGGAGRDVVEAVDGERDYLDCGSGNDAARVDPYDRVARNCEVVAWS
jgi:Ca2+-binding RTX toxin-like protein